MRSYRSNYFIAAQMVLLNLMVYLVLHTTFTESCENVFFSPTYYISFALRLFIGDQVVFSCINPKNL